MWRTFIDHLPQDGHIGGTLCVCVHEYVCTCGYLFNSCYDPSRYYTLWEEIEASMLPKVT